VLVHTVPITVTSSEYTKYFYSRFGFEAISLLPHQADIGRSVSVLSSRPFTGNIPISARNYIRPIIFMKTPHKFLIEIHTSKTKLLQSGGQGVWHTRAQQCRPMCGIETANMKEYVYISIIKVTSG
jgi:hypothetical protein